MTSRSVLGLAFLAVAACSGSSATTSDASDSGASGGDGSDGGTSTDEGGTTFPGPDGSTTTTSTDVSIIVEPNGNHASELVSAINAAKTSVYMTMYQIDNTNVITAIKGQETAGLDVKIVLDGSSTNKTFNTPAFNAFNGIHAGTAVWSNPTFTYTDRKSTRLNSSH